MSHIDELNDQVRRCNAKIEEHLDAQASATVTTSNVSITLATALAAGIAVLAREALPNEPAPVVLTLLMMAAAFTVLSLILGVFVFVARSGISSRAVKMWDASKQQAIAVLLEGEGDEEATALAYEGSLPDMAVTLRQHAAEHEKAHERSGDLMAYQVALLATAVNAALIAALFIFLTAPPA